MKDPELDALVTPEKVEKRFVEIASFFARLATLPSLRTLREGERLLLEEDARRLLYSWMDDLTPVILTRRAPRRELWDEAKLKPPPKLRKSAKTLFLEDVHEIAREWLLPLVDSETVFPDPDKLGSPAWAVRDGEFREAWRPPDPARRGPEGMLIATFRHRKFFPYARCPTCRSVFVRRMKRQKYCSANCTYLGSETSRKERKREYMRRYMADRRARQRRAKLKGRKS